MLSFFPAGKATLKRRRNNVRACRRIDDEKALKTQMESTLRIRRRFNVQKSTSDCRSRFGVTFSTSYQRPKIVENANGIDVENSTSFQRLEIDVGLSTSLRCYIFDVVSTSKKSLKRKRKRR